MLFEARLEHQEIEARIVELCGEESEETQSDLLSLLVVFIGVVADVAQRGGGVYAGVQGLRSTETDGRIHLRFFPANQSVESDLTLEIQPAPVFRQGGERSVAFKYTRRSLLYEGGLSEMVITLVRARIALDRSDGIP